MQYRKEIDGIRGLSVIFVILFHAKVQFFEGGYLGVDIFFVISGFLITNIILKQLNEGNFNLLYFFERRARRILPALVFLLISISIISIFLLFPDEIVDYSKNVNSVLFFYANHWFVNKVSYFDINQENLLTHLWSLSVEEQFYILFPILLIFIYKLKNNYFLLIIFFIFILSVILTQFGGNLKFHKPFLENELKFFAIPGFGFYILPTRIWELLAGSITAYLMMNKRIKYQNFSFLSYLGILLIFISIILFDAQSQHPSILTLVPILGVCLVIMFISKKTILYKILSNKLFTTVGLISYSLYLWHYPIFKIIEKIFIIDISFYYYFFGIIISIIISFLSYKFIEKPFRNKTQIKLSLFLKIVFSLYIILILYTLIFIKSNGMEHRFSANVISIYNSKNNFDTRILECSLYGKNTNNYCIRGADVTPNTVLLGDSHAAILAKSIEKIYKKKNKSFAQLTYDGCPPALNLQIFKAKNFKCELFYADALKYLKDNPNIKNVIIAARWPTLIDGERFNNQLGGIESGDFHKVVPIISNQLLLDETKRKSIIKSEISKYIKEIINLDKKIILIYSIPENGWNVPKTYARYLKFYGEISNNLFIRETTFKKRTQESSLFLDELSKIDPQNKIIRVKPEDYFCNSKVKKKCIAYYDGKILYFDDDHLSIFGSDFLIEKISNKIMFE